MEATHVCLLLLLLLVGGSLSRPPLHAVDETGDAWQSAFRLDGRLLPLHYDITLTPYDESFQTFAGVVVVDIQVEWEANEIILYAGKELGKFEFPVVEEIGGGPKIVRSHYHNPMDELYTIMLDQPALEMPDKRYRATIKYNGTLSADQKGFFAAALKDGERSRNLVMTQFAPMYARRAFPCFDEPSYQATFTLSIVHPEHLVAVATMPVSTISHTGESNGFVKTTFETTRVMSPHSLSWMLTDLAFAGEQHGRLHTYGRREVARPLTGLQATSTAVLQLLQEYTGLAGPDKLDEVVVPQLVATPVASYGMLAYKEEAVLPHRQYNSASRLAGVLSVAGGLANQWFSNMVTPSWWGHAWLGSGFATLLQYELVNKTNPELQMMDKFGVMETMQALAADSRADALPLTADAIARHSDVDRHMGVLSCAKGASVLRMLQQLVTEETFQKGVQYYFSDRKYNTSTPGDLWAALQRAADEDETAPRMPIANFGRSWTEQAGYPVLTAIRNYDDGDVLVYQTPFPRPSGSDTAGWYVPIQLASKDDGDLDPEVHMISASDPVVDAWGPTKPQDWMIINADQIGYYRVNYDLFNWLCLLRAFNNDPDAELPSESSRAMLLDDALSLADQGLLEYPVALRLMEAMLVRERQPAPWIVASRHIDRLAKYFRGASSLHEIAFDSWVRSLVDGVFVSYGFPVDEDEVLGALPSQALRAVVTKIACQAMHPQCAAAARRQYLQWRNGDSVSGDSLALAVCHGVRGPWARADALPHALSMLGGADAADVIKGLGCLSGQHRTNFLRSLVAGGDLNADQSKLAWRALAASQTGLRLALDALRQDWQYVAKTFGDTFLAHVLLDLAASATTDAHLEAVRELASHLSPVTHKEEAEAAVRLAEDRVAWRDLYFYSVFDEMSPSGAEVKGLSYLPDKVVPLHYALRLATKPQPIYNDQAESSVEMTVMATEDTDLLSFHAGKGLYMKHLVVTDDKNEALVQWYSPNTWNAYQPWNMFNEASEIVSVRLDAAMLADSTYTVVIDFIPRYDVQVGDVEGGLFVDILPDGATTVMGARMEPKYARHVFPCFDEPRFLATFSLAVAVETGDATKEVLSISPQTSSGPDPALPDMTVVEFEPTSALPTHLLGVAVLDPMAQATALPSKPAPGGVTPTVTSLRVRSEMAGAAAAAARQAADILGVLDDALGPRSPLSRQEIVAVARMEERPIIAPGLALVREGDVLASDGWSPSEQSVLGALALANAQVHTFFGNDVMIEEWEGLWLREGLAAYLESWAVDQLNGGSYGAVARAGVDRVHPGLALDAVETAAPLATRGADVANKGAGVVRMLAAVLGEQALFDGLRAVMEDVPAKLSHEEVLQTLQRAAGQDTLPVSLVDLARSWAYQTGFPVLTVTRDYPSGTAAVRQERFGWDPSAVQSGSWIVPLNLATAKTYGAEAPRALEVLTTPSKTVFFDADEGDFLLVNVGQSGFYRVNYDAQNWRLLTAAAADGVLSGAQRAALLDDAVALSRAGRLDVEVVLDLLKAVVAAPADAEPCVPCWAAARTALATLGHLTKRHPDHSVTYKQFIAEKLIRPAAVEWQRQDGEDWQRGVLRGITSQVACVAEDGGCMTVAGGAAEAWKNARGTDTLGIDTDLLAASMCFLMSRAPTNVDFVEINIRASSTEDASARRAYIAGLGCVRDEAMRKLLLKTTATNTGVELADVLPMFESLMDNSDAPLDPVVDYVVENWADMTEKLGEDVAGAVLYAVAERVHEDRHYAKFASLLTASTSMTSPVQVAVRRAAANQAWTAAARPRLVSWVYEQMGKEQPPSPTPPPTTSPRPTQRPTSSPRPPNPPTSSPRPPNPPTSSPRPPNPPTSSPSPTKGPNSATATSASVLAVLLAVSAVLLF